MFLTFSFGYLPTLVLMLYMLMAEPISTVEFRAVIIHLFFGLPGVSTATGIVIVVNRIQNELFNITTKLLLICSTVNFVALWLPFVWDWCMRDYFYKGWLNTFEEDWHQSGKYWFWWQMSRWNSWTEKMALRVAAAFMSTRRKIQIWRKEDL